MMAGIGWEGVRLLVDVGFFFLFFSQANKWVAGSFFNLPQLMAMAVGWKAGLRFGVDPMPAPLCRVHGEALREMKDGLALYTMNRKTIQLARDERWVGLVHDE
jgi:hypothetical protein